MEIFVVTYFYPGGVYAGIMGMYSSQALADAAILSARLTDYSDCSFVITSGVLDA